MFAECRGLLSTIENKDTSSTNSFTVNFKPCGKSLTLIRKRRGQRIDPRGTPAFRFLQSEFNPFNVTL